MVESIDYNVFQYGENLVEEFKRQLDSGEASDLSNTRIYKKIEE